MKMKVLYSLTLIRFGLTKLHNILNTDLDVRIFRIRALKKYQFKTDKQHSSWSCVHDSKTVIQF